MDKPEYTRLHITPLTPSLLATLLPASILPHARNISYHTIQTSPENSYGFVDLPLEEAELVRKKFHGCFLRGAKVRIEEARPLRREAPPSITSSSLTLSVVEAPCSERRRKRSRDELPGVDIGERHVKRGWTTPAYELKTKKTGPQNTQSQMQLRRPPIKSKYTTGPECLFKTILPANVSNSLHSSNQLENCKKRKNSRELTVHEFAKTTKYATFLKSRNDLEKTSTNLVAQFVDGKGWLDAHGNLVEEACKRGSNRSCRRVDDSVGRRDPSVKKAELVTEMEVLSSSSSSVEEAENSYPSSPSEGACYGTSNTGSIEKGLDEMELDSEFSESEIKRNDLISERKRTISSSTSSTSTSSFSNTQEPERPLHISSSSSTSTISPSSSSESSDDDVDFSVNKIGPPRFHGTDVRPSSRASSNSSHTTSSSSTPSTSVSKESSEEELATDREETDDDEEKEKEKEKEKEDDDQLQPSSFDSKTPTATNTQLSTTASLSKTKPIHPLASLFKRSGPIEPKPMFTFFPTEREESINSEEQPQSSPQSCMTDLLPFSSGPNIKYCNSHSLAPTPKSTHLHRKLNRSPIIENEIEGKDADNKNQNDDATQRLSPRLNQKVEREEYGAAEKNRYSLSPSIEKPLPVGTSVKVTMGKQSQDLEQSDFQKWFWTNQGQINRAWKKRRKSVCKENKSRKYSKKTNQ